MRLIDADALIYALETIDYSGSPESLEDWTPQDLTKVEIADINNAPSIDAEPIRHGHWNIVEGMPTQCSVCGYYVKQKTFNYCPYCGARMEGE